MLDGQVRTCQARGKKPESMREQFVYNVWPKAKQKGSTEIRAHPLSFLHGGHTYFTAANVNKLLPRTRARFDSSETEPQPGYKT